MKFQIQIQIQENAQQIPSITLYTPTYIFSYLINFNISFRAQKMMGKVYREFSRQKYNKYKHQFPKMRQSQIVSKIIREWDILDNDGKQRLKKQYQQNKFSLSQDLSQSQSAKKSDQTKKKQRETTIKKLQTPQKEQVISDIKYQHDIIQIENKQKIQYLQPFQDNIEKNIYKSKQIYKEPKKQIYLTFYKHYYQKYSKEHPRWNSKQISEVIKLEWQKRKEKTKLIQLKRQKTQRKRQKKAKILSGRKYFKTTKKLTTELCKNAWKRLTIQSKKLWQSESKGGKTEVKKFFKIHLKAATERQTRSFDFLNKIIQ